MANCSDNKSSAGNQQGRPDKQLQQTVSSSLGWYIAGFVDGEGSFNISLRKKQDYKTRWQPVLSFNVSQKDKTILETMLQVFTCGIIKQRKDGLFSFDVTTPSDLCEHIIPFFSKFTFYSKSKCKNFQLFVQACELMNNQEHLQEDGLRKLLIIREKLNQGKGRKRKYSFRDVYPEPSETIRQARYGGKR